MMIVRARISLLAEAFDHGGLLIPLPIHPCLSGAELLTWQEEVRLQPDVDRLLGALIEAPKDWGLSRLHSVHAYPGGAVWRSYIDRLGGSDQTNLLGPETHPVFWEPVGMLEPLLEVLHPGHYRLGWD